MHALCAVSCAGKQNSSRFNVKNISRILRFNGRANDGRANDGRASNGRTSLT